MKKFTTPKIIAITVLVIYLSSCVPLYNSYYPNTGSAMIQSPDVHPWAVDTGVALEGWLSGSFVQDRNKRDDDPQNVLSDSTDYLGRDQYSMYGTLGWSTQRWNGALTLGYNMGLLRNRVDRYSYQTLWLRTSNALVIKSTDIFQLEFPTIKLSMYRSYGDAEAYLKSMQNFDRKSTFSVDYNIGVSNTTYEQFWLGMNLRTRSHPHRFNYTIGFFLESVINEYMLELSMSDEQDQSVGINAAIGYSYKNYFNLSFSLLLANVTDYSSDNINSEVSTASYINLGICPSAIIKSVRND